MSKSSYMSYMLRTCCVECNLNGDALTGSILAFYGGASVDKSSYGGIFISSTCMI